MDEQSRLREVADKLASTVDLKEDKQRRVNALTERNARGEEMYRTQKEEAETELSKTLTKIEQIELEINDMKQEQTRILEDSEGSIHQLDNELIQQRQVTAHIDAIQVQTPDAGTPMWTFAHVSRHKFSCRLRS